MEYRPVKLFVREICFEPIPSIFSTMQGSELIFYIIYTAIECILTYMLFGKQASSSLFRNVNELANSRLK